MVQLNQLQWRDYLENPNPLATALLTRMQVAPHERRAVKAACMAYLMRLPISAKRRRILRQFLEVYLPLQPEEERLLRAVLPDLAPIQPEESMTQIVGTWERLGAVEIITEALDKRFGPLNAAIKDQIALYPYEMLKALNLAQFDFASLADLVAWLNANPVPPWVDPLGEWDEDEESPQ